MDSAVRLRPRASGTASITAWTEARDTVGRAGHTSRTNSYDSRSCSGSSTCVYLPMTRVASSGLALAAAMLAYCTASMALSEAFASPLFLLVGLALAAAAAQTRPITADRRDPSSEPRACAG